MKKIQYLILLILFSSISIYSQSSFFNFEEIKLNKKYKELSGLGKYRYDSISYKKAIKQKEHSFFKFNYNSDSLVIEGYIIKPTHITNKKHPVIIYNRWGTGNFGKLSP